MIPAVYGSAEMPLSGSFVVFDTETTGLDSNTERLTEIGAVYVENGKINEEKKFCTFVNPGKPIPQKVVDLTGINDAMVADAPTPEEAIRAFKEFCGDNILVAHNAHSFDMLFIRKAGEKAGVSWDENTYIDTLPMGRHSFRVCATTSWTPSTSTSRSRPSTITAPSMTPWRWPASMRSC